MLPIEKNYSRSSQEPANSLEIVEISPEYLQHRNVAGMLSMKGKGQASRRPSRDDYLIERVSITQVRVSRNGKPIHTGLLTDIEARHQINYDIAERRNYPHLYHD